MTKISNQYSLTNILTADLANSRLGINNVSPTVALDVTGAGKFSGVLTLGSTISNGTYTYTLPSATGTLALTSALSGYLPLTGGTLTGALGGTSATFSGNLDVATTITNNSTNPILDFLRTNSTVTPTAQINFKTSQGTVRWQIGINRAVGGFEINEGDASSNRFNITSGGAATFSSSVMVNGSTVSTEGLSVQYNQAKTYTTQTAVSRWHSNESSGSQFKLNLFAIGNATGSSRVFSFQTSNEGVANDGIISLQAGGGNVGIGTTSPSNKLSILSNGSTSTGADSTAGVAIYGDTQGSWITARKTSATPSEAQFGADSIGTFLTSLTTHPIVFRPANTEKMRIASNGNIGIGTSTTPELVNINSSAGCFIEMSGGSSSQTGFILKRAGTAKYQWVLNNDDTLNAYNYNIGLNVIRVTSAGRILMSGLAGGGGQGILEVTNTGGTYADNAPSISCVKSSATTSSSARFMQFYASNGSQPMGGIVGNGAENVQFATLSDIRDKENIQPIDGSLNKILALNPVEFNWKKSKEHVKAGFIAQQVEEVFPEYVLDNFANEGDEPRKAITGGLSSGIIVHLVSAIQELSAKVSLLENK